MKMWKKYNYWVILAVVGLLAMPSCSNEFDLTERWKEITVVYGLLNQADTAQYIRIEKAFLDEKTSAYVIAQNADSLFHKSLTVDLQAIPISSGSGGVYRLQRVDGNLEGYAKDGGIFAQSPNYLYKTTVGISAANQYRLVVTNTESDKVLTATTFIAEDFTLLNPATGAVLRLEPGKTLSVTWEAKPNSKFFDVALQMNYTEAPANDPANTQTKKLLWKIGTNVQPSANNNIITLKAPTDDFYKFVGENIAPNVGLERRLVDVDIVIYAGGEELLKYIEIGLANSGLTSSEILPVYTNVEDGLGIFSSRYYKNFAGFDIFQTAKDSLKAGQYTKNLGFK